MRRNSDLQMCSAAFYFGIKVPKICDSVSGGYKEMSSILADQ